MVLCSIFQYKLLQPSEGMKLGFKTASWTADGLLSLLAIGWGIKELLKLVSGWGLFLL